MPSLTPDKLLQRAIPFACNDRESFIDAYSGVGPEAEEARASIVRFNALKGVRLDDMNEEQHRDAMRVFVWAEQWEQSLADSNPGRGVERQCRRNVEYFRTVRYHIWGRTSLEQMMLESDSVPLYPASDADRKKLEAVARQLVLPKKT